MKQIIFSMFLMLGSAAFAEECVNSKGQDIYNDGEAIQTAIESKTTCYEAAELARACQHGSSMDSAFAGAAYDTCSKELEKNKPSKALKALLAKMEPFCDDSQEGGTLGMSMSAHCRLSAIEWINSRASD